MEPLSQRDNRWKNDKLGFSNTTIEYYGCTITSLAWILKTTPDIVNQKLKKVKGYSDGQNIGKGNLIVWEAIPRAFPQVEKAIRVRSYDNEAVKNNLPCLVEVDGSRIGASRHWVVYLGNQQMMDPWFGNIKNTSFYKPVGYTIIKLKEGVSNPDQDGQSMSTKINIEGVGEVTADLEGLKKVDEFLQEERKRLVDEKKKVEKLSVAAARYAEFEKMGFTNPKEVETAFETVKEERDKERATNAQTAREYKDAYKDLVRDLANALGSSQQPPEIMDAVRKALKAESEWASKEKQYKADRKEWMDNEMKLKDEIARLQARLEGEQDPNLEEILKMLIKRLRKLVIERRPV